MSITAAVEPFSSVIEEAKPMLVEHWKELALNQDKVPLSPMWQTYAQREAAGEVMVVTLREAGRLVGYFCGMIGPGLHYATCLTLIMDIFFVHPDVRGRHGGIRLFRAVEKEAKRRGVQRMFVGSKMHKDTSRLFNALGYHPCETSYSCWLGD